ncbi:porin family protein, partial [Desulfovibrio sp. OttesenSCG-928-F07]|nr:porin family protein [Desulfovibrio sp. OttesenSCG-928-F07]
MTNRSFFYARPAYAKLLLPLLLFITLLFPSQALAEIKWYIGPNIIVSQLQLKDFRYKKGSTTTEYDDKNCLSGGVGLVTGYHFIFKRHYNFRLEFEHSLRSGHSFNFGDDKKLRLYTYLTSTVNLFYHPYVGSFPLKPYLGAGLGTGSVLYDQRLQSSKRFIFPSPMINGSLGTGFLYSLSDSFFLDFGYRYHRGLRIKNTLNSNYDY